MQKWFFNEIIHASSSKKKTFFQHSLVNSYIYAKYLYSGEQGLSCDRSMMILRRSSWNYNVKTTLGRRFLNIVDRHFPKNNPLHKIINRHTRAKILLHAKYENSHLVTNNKKTAIRLQSVPKFNTNTRQRV